MAEPTRYCQSASVRHGHFLIVSSPVSLHVPPMKPADMQNYVVEGEEVSAPPEVLLMRHDISGGHFPFTGADWALNKHDPSAKLFSRMDELDDYLGEDGIYNFKSGS